jgi:peptidoglycan-associated lipoprotein
MNKHMNFLMTFLVVATLSFTACSKKTKTDDTIPTATNADDNMNGDSDSGKAMGLQTVHFAYDAFTLDGATKSTLKANAQILKDKGSVKIQVEGHCDNRGGIQYNVALGEKRANSVKKFLLGQGVSADRVTTISFGKEKPIAQGDTEEAYAQNRRANFAITAR